MGLAVGAVAIFPCAAGLCSFNKPPYGRFLKSPKKNVAIKFWRFSVLGMGVWG